MCCCLRRLFEDCFLFDYYQNSLIQLIVCQNRALHLMTFELYLNSSLFALHSHTSQILLLQCLLAECRTIPQHGLIQKTRLTCLHHWSTYCRLEMYCYDGTVTGTIIFRNFIDSAPLPNCLRHSVACISLLFRNAHPVAANDDCEEAISEAAVSFKCVDWKRLTVGSIGRQCFFVNEVGEIKCLLTPNTSFWYKLLDSFVAYFIQFAETYSNSCSAFVELFNVQGSFHLLSLVLSLFLHRKTLFRFQPPLLSLKLQQTDVSNALKVHWCLMF